MLLKSFLYKVLNKICSADVTRVLFLDRHTFKTPEVDKTVICRFASKSDLERLAVDRMFGIRADFVSDFDEFGFQAVIASISDQVVGITFFSSGAIPARHNSGGAVFNGIGVDTPAKCFYLFKVAVLEAYRGRRINASMITYMIDSHEKIGLDSIITTTDWTNTSFLKSAARMGFVYRGYASELVVKGFHWYQLPSAVSASSENAEPHINDKAPNRVYFRGE